MKLNPANQKVPNIMERLATLIGKLNEQFAQNADPAQLMVTIQLIQGELIRLSSTSGKSLSTSKVAVVMPSMKKYSNSEPSNISIEKEQEILQVVEKNGTHQAPKAQEEKLPSFNPLTEVPTLAHQPGPKELNEWIGSIPFPDSSAISSAWIARAIR